MCALSHATGHFVKNTYGGAIINNLKTYLAAEAVEQIMLR